MINNDVTDFKYEENYVGSVASEMQGRANI